MTVFQAAFLGNLAAFTIIATVFYAVVQRDIRNAQEKVKAEAAAGREMLTALLEQVNAENEKSTTN